MPSWIQDPKTGKLIPREEYRREENKAPYIQGDLESFVSPIDGSVISDRGKLREHNLRHGVTNIRDYGDGWFERKERERNAEIRGSNERATRDRIDTIQRAIYEHTRG